MIRSWAGVGRWTCSLPLQALLFFLEIESVIFLLGLFFGFPFGVIPGIVLLATMDCRLSSFFFFALPGFFSFAIDLEK